MSSVSLWVQPLVWERKGRKEIKKTRTKRRKTGKKEGRKERFW